MRDSDVLAVARRLFAAGGYDGLHLDEVAADAGVSRSWLYARYPDRTALLVALVESESEKFFRGLAASVKPSQDLEALLRQCFELYVDYVAERRSEYLLLFGPEANLEPEVAQRMAGLRQRMARAYVRMFRNAIEAEDVPWPSDAEALIIAHSIIGLAEGSVHSWLTNPGVSRAEVIDSTVAMMRRALLGHRASA